MLPCQAARRLSFRRQRRWWKRKRKRGSEWTVAEQEGRQLLASPGRSLIGRQTATWPRRAWRPQACLEGLELRRHPETVAPQFEGRATLAAQLPATLMCTMRARLSSSDRCAAAGLRSTAFYLDLRLRRSLISATQEKSLICLEPQRSAVATFWRGKTGTETEASATIQPASTCSIADWLSIR